MKRLSTIERYALVLGIVFLVYGVITIIWPQAGIVPHFTNDALGMSPRYEQEVVSFTKSRVYAAFAMLMGVGIIAASIYREKR